MARASSAKRHSRSAAPRSREGMVKPQMAAVAERLGIEGAFHLLAAFLLILVAVVLLSRIAGRLVARALKLLHLGAADQIGGVLFGILKAIVLLSVIIYYVETIDHKHILLTTEAIEKSLLYRPVNGIGNLLLSSIKLFVQGLSA